MLLSQDGSVAVAEFNYSHLKTEISEDYHDELPGCNEHCV